MKKTAKKSFKKVANKSKAQVAIIMGSRSDLNTMQAAAAALEELEIEYSMNIVSAHRMPLEMADFAISAKKKGLRVIIAGAGGAAHLPGMVAAHTNVPVIGVPIPHGNLSGLDALYSIVQMPKGVPVATVAIGGAYNAGLLAGQILATSDTITEKNLYQRLEKLREKMHQEAKESQP
ncbi:MAG: 5-(carboxyamino)imidazole ribonucleotide mutase [Oligoflexales bacterium]|nr:5-(carboxyamino)imidazole ribonucleotide mutase [Oligoflexales bacterium]